MTEAIAAKSGAPVFLIVDDNADQIELLARTLAQGFPGCTVARLSDPDRVLEVTAGLRPDMVFLDWVFPRGRTGPALCRMLKAQALTRATPVVLMSGQRTGLGDRFKTVRSGADLFLEKPFPPQAAVGYARALLQKAADRGSSSLLRLGALTLNRDSAGVSVGTHALPALPPRLFELLWLLARRSPQPVAIPELIRFAYGDSVRDRYITVALTRLRRRLPSALRIEPVPGRGYRLTVD